MKLTGRRVIIIGILRHNSIKLCLAQTSEWFEVGFLLCHIQSDGIPVGLGGVGSEARPRDCKSLRGPAVQDRRSQDLSLQSVSML